MLPTPLGIYTYVYIFCGIYVPPVVLGKAMLYSPCELIFPVRSFTSPGCYTVVEDRYYSRIIVE